MIRRRNDRARNVTEHFKGADGRLVADQILTGAEEMNGKGRLFNHCRLDKDCGIGWHVHAGDDEIYYILSGEGEFNDNGTAAVVRPGDVLVTRDGEGHALVNRGDEPLEFIALILYK